MCCCALQGARELGNLATFTEICDVILAHEEACKKVIAEKTPVLLKGESSTKVDEQNKNESEENKDEDKKDGDDKEKMYQT